MEAREDLWLKLVRRVDPHVIEIVKTGSRTALYTFEKENNSWSKTDVEGTFMVYAREAEPFYMIIILNRLSKNNFLESLTSNCEVQAEEPFLLFRNSKDNIFGIWFTEGECVPEVASIITEKIKLSKSQPKVIIKEKGDDILNMLSKAHNAFEGKEETLALQGEAKNTDVANFFAKVGKSNACSTEAKKESDVGSASSVLQKLFEGAAAAGGQASVRPNTTAVPIPTQPVLLPTKMTPTSSNISCVSMSLQELEGKLKENLQVSNLSQVDPLLSPQVFTAQEKNSSCVSDLFNAAKPQNKSPFTVENKSGHISNPQSFNMIKEDLESPKNHLTPLTSDQLVSAFNMLLKKPDFVKQLHEAYVESFSQSHINGFK